MLAETKPLHFPVSLTLKITMNLCIKTIEKSNHTHKNSQAAIFGTNRIKLLEPNR